MTRDVKLTLWHSALSLVALIVNVFVFPEWQWLWGLLLLLVVNSFCRAMKMQNAQIRSLKQIVQDQHWNAALEYDEQQRGYYLGAPQFSPTPMPPGPPTYM